MTVQSLRHHVPLRFLTSLLSGLIFLTAAATQAAPFAYISNYGTSGVGNTVSVIDIATNTVTATVTVGNRPYGVAVTPDGARVYVANQFSDTVSVISTATNTVIATVAVGSRPFGVAVTPDGSRVYVANFFGASVSVISTATNTVTATVALGSGSTPAGVTVTPDGARAYVASGNMYAVNGNTLNTVSAISTATNTVIATIAVGGGSDPLGMAVTPDGSRVYVANVSSSAGTVSVISTATNTVIATVAVGVTPAGVAVTPDGSRVYVTDFNNASVSVISTATNNVTATIAVGVAPAGVAVTPDGARVYVTNSYDANVSVISTATNTVIATVPVGIGPRGLGMFITPATACTPPPSGMVAWYPLNELAGATAINDIAPPPSSTFNNVGTPQPGPVGSLGPPPAGPAPVVGEVGGALYFYGPYVEVAPNSELDFSTGDFSVDAGVTAFSIDAWVRAVQVGPTLIQPIVDKFSSPGGPGFAFYIRNQNLELNINGNTFVSTGPPIAFANPLANTGPWYHVAVTVQGGGRRLGQGAFYINGAPAGTFAPPLGNTANNSLPLWIGATRVPGPKGEIAIDELEIFNRALSAGEIQAINNAGSAGKCKCVQAPPNMVGWWPGDNSPNDISGLGNNGTLQGLATYGGGTVGNAFALNATGDFVEVLGNPPSLDFSLRNFSIDAWIRTTNTTGSTITIVDKRTGTTANPVGYHVFLAGGQLGFQLADGSPVLNHVNPLSPVITDGNWHHVAATINRSSTTGGNLYVDGSVVHTFDPTTRPGNISNTANLRIGQHYVTSVQPSQAFQGGIDEVEVFNRELSATEIQAIYNAGSAGKCKVMPRPTGPTSIVGGGVACFPLQQPSGSPTVVSNNPSLARPLSEAVSGNNYSWLFELAAFAGPVDNYLLLQLPSTGVFFLEEQPTPQFSPTAVTLVPSTSGPVTFNPLFTVPYSALVGTGTYFGHVFVVPAGTNPATFSLATSPYYHWCFQRTF